MKKVTKQKTVILGVTGSIAAFKSAEIIRRLREKACRVIVVMTRDAEHFITPLTLSSLAGEKVYRGKIGKGDDSWQMPHIQLAKKANVLLIAPATANIIGKMACGIADDLLTCIALVTKAKILIAPAMNTEMYRNKIVQKNCYMLKNLGMIFVDPTKGQLACGDFGAGHIADEDTIVKAVLKAM